MQPWGFERHLEALTLAGDCVELGARLITVRTLTGLKPCLIKQLLPSSTLRVSGRPPMSVWNIVSRSIMTAIEASEICRVFEELLRLGVSDGRALVTTYRVYATRQKRWGRRGGPRKRAVFELKHVRISFDQAFEIVCACFGAWEGSRELQLTTCCCCGSRHVACIGAVPKNGQECPYCRLRKNFEHNNLFVKNLFARSADGGSLKEFAAVKRIEATADTEVAAVSVCSEAGAGSVGTEKARSQPRLLIWASPRGSDRIGIRQ